MIHISEFYENKAEIDEIIDDNQRTHDDGRFMLAEGSLNDLLPLSSLGVITVVLDAEIPRISKSTPEIKDSISDNILEIEIESDSQGFEKTPINDAEVDKSAHKSFFLANLHWFLLALILCFPLARSIKKHVINNNRSDDDENLADIEEGDEVQPNPRGNNRRN